MSKRIVTFLHDRMMQNLSDISGVTPPPILNKQTGTANYNRLSAKYGGSRKTQEKLFSGLPNEIGHYDLLLLVKKTGKHGGFSPRMIALLDYYMAFTRKIDWEEGAAFGPVIYQSLARTALDLGVSERHIQRIEKQLHDIGALDWQASGNYKRYGQRCEKTGRLLYAYGVDLSPLAALYATLKTILKEKKARDDAWMKYKRQISFYRRSCKDMLADLQMLAEEEQGDGERGSHTSIYQKLDLAYSQIAFGRIRAGMPLERLERSHSYHKSLHDALILYFETIFCKENDINQELNKNETVDLKDTESGRDVKNVVHNKVTTQEKIDKSNSRKNFEKDGGKELEEAAKIEHQILNPMETSGLAEISLRDVLKLLTPELREKGALEDVRNWPEFVDMAQKHSLSLFISIKSWQAACEILSRNGAALCVLLTERAVRRQINPIKKPGHYFNALLTKAKAGTLNLDVSILKNNQG